MAARVTLSVDTDSCTHSAEGERVAIMRVLVFPPSESYAHAYAHTCTRTTAPP